MSTDALATSIAGSVADRDLDRLGSHLAPDVILRALLPSRVLEERGREAVLARWDAWFGDRVTVSLVEATGDDIGDRVLVHYKLRFDPERQVLTQTLVCGLTDGLVDRVDLVCSGFREER